MMKKKTLNDLAEIINLEAIRELPKATEHFISDIHGEFEAFDHIRRNCSGIIRIKVQTLFEDELDEQAINELCFAIYYPEDFILGKQRSFDKWQSLLKNLVNLTRFVSSKYTRSKVRKALPSEYAYILEELLYQYDEHDNKNAYYHTIFKTIIELELAPQFATELSYLIQRFVVDHLHVLGDIYDRGAHPDKVMDVLMSLPSVDITLGNHDIIWMGAYAGNMTCLATVLRIAFRYGHTQFLEESYNIDLSRLKKFALRYYQENAAFKPKLETPIDAATEDVINCMHQAMTIMQFKLEGQLIERRPEFQMNHRNLLPMIDPNTLTINIEGQEYHLDNTCFDLIDWEQPNELTLGEELILLDLLHQFQNSAKLKEHMEFLLENGKMYLTYNDNLLFHGCIPVNEEGQYYQLSIDNQLYQGKSLMDFYATSIEESFKQLDSHDDWATDTLWYLWCGPSSTLFGKDIMRTFERYFISDKIVHSEIKNPYYEWRKNEQFCLKLLNDFGLTSEGYIINGHTPVKTIKGENPIKANGKMLVIDGGLSTAYQKVTGIAGYTLVDNSNEVYLVAHHPFTSKQKAIEKYLDIFPTQLIVKKRHKRQYVKNTDIGKELERQSQELKTKILYENDKD